MTKNSLIIVTGPTASGKSALAALLAHRLQTEVISADSRQIFKGIPIATAVPDEEERSGITHHLLESLPLDAYYSASEFEQDALKIAAPLLERNGTAIVCGGSMMYVDALCNGIDDIPTVPAEIRNSLMAEWRENGDEWLLSRLNFLDPVHYGKVDKKNLKRVFHSVEISLTAGRPYSSLLTGERRERPFNIIKVMLTGERQILFSRINRRVEIMMEKGLEEEASSVLPLRGLNSLNTVGIKEMFQMFDGVLTKEEAVARIQKNTRVYAKKQLTWYARDNGMLRLDLTDGNEANIERILGAIP